MAFLVMLHGAVSLGLRGPAGFSDSFGGVICVLVDEKRFLFFKGGDIRPERGVEVVRMMSRSGGLWLPRKQHHTKHFCDLGLFVGI